MCEVRVVNRRLESFDVYIGRGSKWGNPFTVAEYGRMAAIGKYQEWLLSERHDLIAALSELDGKVLGCYCKPEACHGDILVAMVKARKEGVQEWQL